VNLLSSIFDIINVPIGYLLRYCYLLVSNYGLAIILVGIITKILLVPLAVKQQKSSLAQMKFGPRVREIQQKYATDRDRQQREMAKLQAEGYSPAAGCSTLLIQFPIIIGIYNVIRHPLKYIVGLSDTILASVATRLATIPGFESITVKSPNFEVSAKRHRLELR
jgi:YidC/Oxa1 family membrane protein insertase